MKNISSVLMGLLFVSVGSLVLAAESERATLPEGPIITVPEFFKYEVIYTKMPLSTSGASTGAEDKPMVNVSTITKTKEIRHEILLDYEGKKSDIWGTATMNAIVGEDEANTLICPIEKARDEFQYLSWIIPKNYVGTDKSQGVNCYVFKSRMSSISEKELTILKKEAKEAGTPFNPKDYIIDVAAWVSVETHLPVFASRGTTTFKYRILPPPTEIQVLPEKLEKLIQAEEQRLQDLERKPAAS